MLGISWGTTLALACAQAYPQRVEALVLACVTTTSRREVDWITRGVGPIFPQQWERFAGHIPEPLKDERIVDAYATLLFASARAVSARTRHGDSPALTALSKNQANAASCDSTKYS
jgi:proline iminopeptidase